MSYLGVWIKPSIIQKCFFYDTSTQMKTTESQFRDPPFFCFVTVFKINYIEMQRLNWLFQRVRHQRYVAWDSQRSSCIFVVDIMKLIKLFHTFIIHDYLCKIYVVVDLFNNIDSHTSVHFLQFAQLCPSFTQVRYLFFLNPYFKLYVGPYSFCVIKQTTVNSTTVQKRNTFVLFLKQIQ